MRSWRAWLRSVRGQLSLLAATFAGAVALAVVMVCLRGLVFERYVREVYPPLEGWSEEAAQLLAAPNTSAGRIAELGKEMQRRIDRHDDPKRRYQDLERIYGAWISEGRASASPLLPGRLTRLQRDWVLQRLRRTLVAGRPTQRAAALSWMEIIVVEPEGGDEVVALAEYARRRAVARNEPDLQRLAEAVLAKGRREHGDF
jgi:hypothetical protein